jgi:hypothetical protein
MAVRPEQVRLANNQPTVRHLPAILQVQMAADDLSI